ncbi:transposase [Streptomyces sp. HB-N217]|nr:transposase [Streptomyces sp. HB-N217]
MNNDLVPDDLWERIAPLIPALPPRRRRFPGRKPVDDRTALAEIVYVVRKGVFWADVPPERIGCSGITCWRRLRDARQRCARQPTGSSPGRSHERHPAWR